MLATLKLLSFYLPKQLPVSIRDNNGFRIALVRLTRSRMPHYLVEVTVSVALIESVPFQYPKRFNLIYLNTRVTNCDHSRLSALLYSPSSQHGTTGRSGSQMIAIKLQHTL